jgi:hypothetical protein
MAGVGTAYPADYSATYSGPQFTAQQGRTAMAAAMSGATAARPLGGTSGVRPGTPTNIATANSTTWTVTPFGGYTDLTTSATNGGYFFSFLTPSTGAVTAAAGSARVDLLYVQLADVNTGDGTTVAPRVILDYQAGTAGAGVPALTAPRAFVIARINVPASGGGSPTVTFVAPYAVAAGGVTPYDTYNNMRLITATPGAQAVVYSDPVTSNNGNYFWDPAIGWAPVGLKVQSVSGGKSGSFPVIVQPIIKIERVSGTSTGSGTMAVTFPTAFPTGVLAITFTMGSGSSTTPVLNGDALSTTGFTVAALPPSTAVVFYYTAWGWW